MFNPNQYQINQAIRKDQEAQAARSAMIKEAQAGKSSGNVMQAIVQFAQGFSKKSEQDHAVRESQEMPAIKLSTN